LFKDKETDYVAQNEEEISAYVAKNNLTAQRSDSGLYYITIWEQVRPTATSVKGIQRLFY
jgi:FKBP-type peptidyl-prolyl cis-trans isomerase FkpA